MARTNNEEVFWRQIKRQRLSPTLLVRNGTATQDFQYITYKTYGWTGRLGDSGQQLEGSVWNNTWNNRSGTPPRNVKKTVFIATNQLIHLFDLFILTNTVHQWLPNSWSADRYWSVDNLVPGRSRKQCKNILYFYWFTSFKERSFGNSYK